MAGRHLFAKLRDRMSPDALTKADAEAQRLSEEMKLVEIDYTLASSSEK